ncbi:hypothetical protein B0H17DRAFT_1097119 [Mycena rosella]|uniref:ATP phosphoribosyltransferase n=1 Tax=Mycena rosella TaxID=1033263 RepID=A0AAD7CQJ8_MYCRO|nr:hypothetical protein B0H17DRAFT_1097119 [Mycena rosella]
MYSSQPYLSKKTPRRRVPRPDSDPPATSPGAAAARFKLVFFSPAPNTHAILDHLFETFPAHVGRVGNYEHVAFLSRGTGALPQLCLLPIHTSMHA